MSGSPSQPVQTCHLLALGPVCPDWERMFELLLRGGIQLGEAQWVDSLPAVMSYLRSEQWDCLVVNGGESDTRNLQQLLEGLRTAENSLPVVFISHPLNRELLGDLTPFAEYPLQILQTDAGWESPLLTWSIRHVCEFARLSQLAVRTEIESRQRHERERQEVELILRQQQRLLKGIVSLPAQSGPVLSTEKQTPALRNEYLKLLRQSVVQGTAASWNDLLPLIVDAGMNSGDILALHLTAVESLQVGVGEKSARHILQRAEQFLLETMVQLAETYRQRAA